MTDQQYGDYQFEVHVDGLEGRTPGCGTALRWEDLTWPRGLTTLPILLEGIQHSDDVGRAKDYGVEGIYCPNHGGRQANGGLPALNGLPRGLEAADGMAVLMVVLFDSGVRSASDVAKSRATQGCSRAGVRPLEPT